jgi:uncharacterized membrane protein
MEKLIVIVFDNEPKAQEGLKALLELNWEGEISVYEARIVAKEAGGGVRLINYRDMLTLPAVAGGTGVGALVGLLGGVPGVVVGATAGALIGAIGDAVDLGVTYEFVDDVTAAMTPGKVAVIADIVEEWVTALDTRMEGMGGLVFRRPYPLEKTTQDDLDVAAHRAEMEQLKLERAQARSGRLEKIDARIDHLRTKLENAIERKRVKMRVRQQQGDARIQALQTRAAQSEGEVRQRHEARIAELRRDYAEKAAVDLVGG